MDFTGPMSTGFGLAFLLLLRRQQAFKLIASLLAAPNQDRPFHVEAALLSCLQVTLGFLFFIAVSEAMGPEPFLSLLKASAKRPCLRLGFPLGKALGKLDPKKDIRRQAPRLSPQGGVSSRGSGSLSLRALQVCGQPA